MELQVGGCALGDLECQTVAGYFSNGHLATGCVRF